MGANASVHVGSFVRDYSILLERDIELPAKYRSVGYGSSILANRLSWFYDFKGPSMAVDTACSSSLVALHLACQELRLGAVSMVISFHIIQWVMANDSGSCGRLQSHIQP